MFFLEIVLWSKRKGFANKKDIFIFKSENFAAHEPHARSQILWFFWNWTHKNISDRRYSARFQKSKRSFKSLHPTAGQRVNRTDGRVFVQDISENGADPVHLTAIHKAGIVGGGEPSARHQLCHSLNPRNKLILD